MFRVLLVVFLIAAAAAAGEKPLWLAVGPKEFSDALEPLAAHRARQGLEVSFGVGGVEQRLAMEKRKPTYLLLVGDVARGGGGEPWHVATKSRELYRWRGPQPPRFASDPSWGDPDGDGVLDIVVGRIPARTPEQVKVVVEKILAYENREPTAKDLRLVVWAGAPGYGGFIDSMATGLLVNTVRRHAPAWSSAWLISSDPRQALCGWPPDQPDLFTRAMREGSILNAITAHANADAVFSMRHDGKGVWYHAANARERLAEGPPCAPLVLLACNCGEFDRPRASLAEELLFLPGGPVAAIGATTESHPLTNYYSGVCLLKALGGQYGPAERLGDLWREAQRRALKEQDPIMEPVLRDVEGKLEKTIDVARLRRDQQLMYAFLGDPATKLTLPGALDATLEKEGDVWRWTVPRPRAATRLQAAFKAKGRTGSAAVKLPQEKESARALFRLANAMEGFQVLETRSDTQPWEGTVREPGLLRLVATGPGLLLATVIVVEDG